jgi:hypothetical protein
MSERQELQKLEIESMEPKVYSAMEIQQQVQAIQQVMKAVMLEGTHYGKIPGCGDKPTLLKPGAEKIMMTFRLVCDPEIEDMSNSDCIRYRVRMRIFNLINGSTVGYGIGECSTDESKYKWRSAISHEEFENTDPDKRRIKYFKSGKCEQIRTEIADQANTILKMAKKRAMVDGVLTVTAASDIFTQDIEDIPEENLNSKISNGKPIVRSPQEKNDVKKYQISEKSKSEMLRIMNEIGWDFKKQQQALQKAELVGEDIAIKGLMIKYQEFLLNEQKFKEREIEFNEISEDPRNS